MNQLQMNSIANECWVHVEGMPPAASSKEKVEQQSAASATNEKSWSVGSELHSSGQCKPCAWNWKPDGCAQRANCIRCHLCDENAYLDLRKDRLAGLKANRKKIKKKENKLAASADAAKSRDPNSSS